ILALAVPAALVAGTANASINLYSSESSTVDLSGAAEIQYFKSYDPTLSSYFRIDDAELLLKTSTKVAENLNVVTGMRFNFEDDAYDLGTVTSEELYAGFEGSLGRLTFGRQLLVSDDAGNAKDYELGTAQFDFVQTQANKSIKYVYDNGGMFYGAFSTAFDSNIDKKTGIVDKNDPDNPVTGGVVGEFVGVENMAIFDGRLGFRRGNFDSRIYFYSGNNLSTSKYAPKGVEVQDVTGFNLEANYVMGQFDIAASYSNVDYKASGLAVGHNNVNTWQLSGGYKAGERTYIAIGFDHAISDPSTLYKKVESNDLYGNVTYKVHKNVKMYAEIGISDYEEDGMDVLPQGTTPRNRDLGYVLGMEATF
ncbi:MAG: porin, partial [Vibrionaceae bacterium]